MDPKPYGRRRFLLGTSAVAAAAITSRAYSSVFTWTPARQTVTASSPFEMLVLGDSVVWGQGLIEEDKFYSIVRQKLASEILRRSDIRMVVRAHSGATISPRYEFSPRNYGEVPTSAPTLYAQASMATEFYDASLNVPADKVGLVLLNGGINDIGFPVLLNPFTQTVDVREKAQAIFRQGMKDLLQFLISKFPNALFVVTGYFPVITEGTPEDTLLKLIEAFLSPRENDKVRRKIAEERALLTERSRGWVWTRLVELSNTWKSSSDEFLSATVDEMNRNYQLRSAAFPNCKRVLFARVDIGADEGYNALNTAFFKIITGFKTDDQMYTRRKEFYCTPQQNRLSALDRQVCELAATGHPNLRGESKYADSIIEQLRRCV